ncbi:MAG: hypothetical protein ACFB50_09955 [Rubrobacteraceae bacterium]
MTDHVQPTYVVARRFRERPSGLEGGGSRLCLAGKSRNDVFFRSWAGDGGAFGDGRKPQIVGMAGGSETVAWMLGVTHAGLAEVTKAA